MNVKKDAGILTGAFVAMVVTAIFIISNTAKSYVAYIDLTSANYSDIICVKEGSADYDVTELDRGDRRPVLRRLFLTHRCCWC